MITTGTLKRRIGGVVLASAALSLLLVAWSPASAQTLFPDPRGEALKREMQELKDEVARLRKDSSSLLGDVVSVIETNLELQRETERLRQDHTRLSIRVHELERRAGPARRIE